ncbi:MAG TPA: hypothetical protein DCY13_17180 [Verrucomicrobiales bacterium]|nr:hypothetical protein [Verrucomicrobiales bacterium]
MINMLVLLPTLDAAVAFNLCRFVSHAMNGAERLQGLGLSAPPTRSGPNYELVWHLVHASRQLYRYFALAVVLALAGYGYLVLSPRIGEVPNPGLVWIALLLSIVWAACDIYWGYWGTFLKGMERVLQALRWQTAGYSIRLVLASALLWAGLGLLSLPIAGLVGSLVQRTFSRRLCLRLLNQNPPQAPETSTAPILFALLPNSWRMGLQMFSQLFMINGLSFLCVHHFGLAANASYGLSLQLFTIASGLSTVWSSVNWPTVNTLRFQHDFLSLQALVRKMFGRQTLTYLTLATSAFLLAPTLLAAIQSDSNLLPLGLLLVIAVNQALELNFSFWTTLLAAENKIPSLWPAVVSNLCAVALACWLTAFERMGVAALVAAPLMVGIMFNYWYWMLRGMSSIHTSLTELLARRKSAQESQ